MVLTLPNATYYHSLICSKKPGKVGAISETGSAHFSRELVYGPIRVVHSLAFCEVIYQWCLSLVVVFIIKLFVVFHRRSVGLLGIIFIWFVHLVL